MLVLFEAPAGYCLFKVKDEGKLSTPSKIYKEFEKSSGDVVKLHAFQKFEDTTEAVAAATAVVEGKLDKGLKKFLKRNIVNKKIEDSLGVADTKLGQAIKKKLGIQCANDETVLELIRGVRGSLTDIVPALEETDRKAMALGLSHSLSRYKLKFSPDKVDTMIVQAIGLLDELDKEINTYAMRVREWYGWHFPEMGKIVTDNIEYAKVVLKAGIRLNFKNTDFSDILTEDIEKTMKQTCEISMGTDISEEDIKNVKSLSVQVIELSAYRGKLFEYLKNRMSAIAPNLTVMVGELVGARLIAHAGSLMNLAKAPASTVQILGAEKALFRALKTKHDTPKYGLIYHASLIGQSAPKNKGKISRVLAAKTSLAIRVDALGDQEGATIGYECREKVEARLRQLETGQPYSLQPTSASKDAQKYDRKSTIENGNGQYNEASENTLEAPEKKKRKREEDDESPKKKKKEKDGKKKKKKSLVEDVTSDDKTPKKKKKKSKDSTGKKKKKKKSEE
mmetsp:Transcript_13437/g.15337  ORF Transcript_13437/g.15337 Transcript_13437/m.15337 type:complete len:507 (-) Transcript_13437:1537-3057(-)|eukprot:CAMPEP_0184019658 /NCGR_PEP_ID=MMETSP0954-20121128/8881_1 /TAXON_ID=627963 /ORGANISM="Aplanochytrium sp, Strain PBS07" /LENGTH=506 /DNA_ID=CAMNT_0026301363 /DNA_START=101 /DNA_END=1621 /DNA_ORIENTATION=-